MSIMSSGEYIATLTSAQFKMAKAISDMMVTILRQNEMTPDKLVGCLMSEPYNLAPTEENFDMIRDILNLRDSTLQVMIVKGSKNLSLAPVLYVI